MFSVFCMRSSVCPLSCIRESAFNQSFMTL